MAKTGVFDWDVTAINNADINSITLQENQTLPSMVNNFEREHMSQVAKWRNDLGGAATTSGTNTITVTLASTFAAYATGQRFLVLLGGTNTGACTLNVNGLGAKNVKVITGGVAADPAAGALTSGNYAEFQYDGTNMNLLSSGLAAATNAQAATATSTTLALTPANLAQERGFSNDALINFAIGTPTVSAGALTITFTGTNGSNHSSTNQGYVAFRSATAGSGALAQIILSSAQSLVVPSGASLGSSNNVATTYAIAAFNNAGAIIYGVMNVTTGVPLPLADGIATTTLLSGSSATAGIWYTTTALTSKAYTILGYFVATEVTAGTWATVPSTVQMVSARDVNDLISAITPWVSYTPTFTGFGTATNISFQSRRVGDTLEVQGKFTSGTSTATEARITLGYNGVDSSVTTSSTKVPSIRMAGVGAYDVNAAAYLIMLMESSVGYMTIGNQAAGSSGLTKLNGSSIISSGQSMTLRGSFPITGW